MARQDSSCAFAKQGGRGQVIFNARRTVSAVYRKVYPNGGIFQQDGAPAHTEVYKKEYFMTEDMLVMDWPAKSPDMNVIENVWGILARRVYQGGRVFDTVEDLQECLAYEWEKLTIHEIRTLIESVPRRITELIVKRGNELLSSFSLYWSLVLKCNVRRDWSYNESGDVTVRWGSNLFLL